MLINILILLVSLASIVFGASGATKHAATLANSFKLSKYLVGFIVIAIISILPETLVSINSAIEGNPSLGLSTLMGSNVADLTLIFAIVVLLAGRGLKVEGKIIKNHIVYPLILLVPIILGLNGHFSRLEGIALIIAGGVFYYIVLRNNTDDTPPDEIVREKRWKSIILFLISMTLLILGSHFAVTSTISLASNLSVSPFLIGILVIGLGTTLPELMVAINSVRGKDDSLAIGDILGTVLADATIVVGILATISPFSFPIRIIYSTGLFMIAGATLLFAFMKSESTLTKKEAAALLFIWLLFITVESLIN